MARAVEMPPVTARRGQDRFDRAIDRYIANSSGNAGGVEASAFAIAVAAMQIGQR